MRIKDFLQDLHIGKMIKGVALQKKVASNKIAYAINRYQNNADKIYNLDDMDADDVVRISYVLEHNLLEDISHKYLAHLYYARS